MSLPENLMKKDRVNILFLDISSTCTGFAIAECDFLHRKANLTKAGCIWLNPKWSHQEKYHYIQKALEGYFWIVEQVDFIVHEAYAVNPKQMGGVMVVPEMIGAIKSGAQENGVTVEDITPQTWRMHLGIKPDITEVKGKKKRDYKEPCKKAILELTSVPEKVKSNITGSERATPSDLYDALGIGVGWLRRLTGASKDEAFFREVTIDKDIEIQPEIGVMDI